MSLNFEWDDRKARINLIKHRIAFEEAATAFGDPLSLTIHDPAHSHGEERFVTIGESTKRRLIVIIHTNRDAIRIISARKAISRERKIYEKKN
jgi:uncharacterized DUF497 family protein